MNFGESIIDSTVLSTWGERLESDALLQGLHEMATRFHVRTSTGAGGAVEIKTKPYPNYAEPRNETELLSLPSTSCGSEYSD